jgi:hypothetical protein
MPRILGPLVLAALISATSPPALAWDSDTHRLIARLAIGGLPSSALKAALLANEQRVETATVEPDTKLKELYGRDETHKHYIDIEDLGNDGFQKLDPDLAAMREKYGAETMKQAGSVPWTVQSIAIALSTAEIRDQCAEVLTLSGYLAHYVGDSTQPLHTTRYYDGLAGDRGLHARFEFAVDREVDDIEPLAIPQVKARRIRSAWDAEVSELKHSHELVDEVFAADRAARGEDEAAYQQSLKSIQPMIVAQVARAASALASIWQYEWQQAGSPVICGK